MHRNFQNDINTIRVRPGAHKAKEHATSVPTLVKSLISLYGMLHVSIYCQLAWYLNTVVHIW